SFMNGEPIIIWRARASRLSYPYLGVAGHVADRNAGKGEVTVLTGDGVLVLEEVETASHGRGRASDVIKSTRVRLGLDLEAELMSLRAEVEDLKKRLS
ncbi:MAG TPA: hypothetical protein VEQ40_06355, partial [Pyrinomonadaceae bacterium]|nr:hypothetical protein [Pyrinomonadaceae bacterium]